MQRLNSNYNQDLYQKAKQKITKLINKDVYLVSKDDKTLDGRNIYKIAFHDADIFKDWNKYYKKMKGLKHSDFQVIMIKNNSKLYQDLSYKINSNVCFPYNGFSVFNDSYHYFFIIPKDIISTKVIYKNPFKFVRLITQTNDLSSLIFDLSHFLNTTNHHLSFPNTFIVVCLLWVLVFILDVFFLIWAFSSIRC